MLNVDGAAAAAACERGALAAAFCSADAAEQTLRGRWRRHPRLCTPSELAVQLSGRATRKRSPFRNMALARRQSARALKNAGAVFSATHVIIDGDGEWRAAMAGGGGVDWLRLIKIVLSRRRLARRAAVVAENKRALPVLSVYFRRPKLATQKAATKTVAANRKENFHATKFSQQIVFNYIRRKTFASKPSIVESPSLTRRRRAAQILCTAFSALATAFRQTKSWLSEFMDANCRRWMQTRLRIKCNLTIVIRSKTSDSSRPIA